MTQVEPLATLQTGVPGFDDVLGGGLPAAGVFLCEGPAGAGKTILCMQIAFHLASQGKRALVVSLLAESHAKLIQHLSTLSYFDLASIPERITFISGYESLAEHGTRGLLELLASALTKTGPQLLIIEGYGTLRTLKCTELEISQITQRLNSLMSTLGCTAILLQASAEPPLRAEHALVDGLIELGTYTLGARMVRELQVVKLRASNPLLGKHVFQISSDGITVYPRLERAAAPRTRPAPESTERVRFGIQSLDAMLSGGLVAGATTLVLGAPGAGKTLLGLKFLEQGVKDGQPGLYFGFYESPERLVGKASAVGVQLGAGMQQGLLEIIWQPPLEQVLDELGYKLLKAVERTKAGRVVIDGIEAFHQTAIRKDRLPVFLTALTAELRERGVDTILVQEQPLPHQVREVPPYIISALMENIILVRYLEVRSKLHRLISILKMRESDYDNSVREFRISTAGIDVAETSGSAERLFAEAMSGDGAPT
jgi:circadian clock protein KaiC